MKQQHQNSRINLAGLKAQIVEKLGPDLSKQYFHFLDKFLSMKMSQIEFNKLCSKIFCRENIKLHNDFILSILKNACTGKHPPPSQIHDIIKSSNAVESKKTSTDVFLQNGPYNEPAQARNLEGLSNGDLSLKKARTIHRDRRSSDRRIAFGANGKTNSVSSEHLIGKDSNFILDNDISIPHDVHQEVSLLPIERERLVSSAQTPLKPSQHCVDEIKTSDTQGRSQLQAPLGLPFRSNSVGGIANKCNSFSNSGSLFDNVTLKERMEQIAASEGLEGGVSMDCVNLLNNGLDAYLKRLISSCGDLVTSRSSYEQVKNRKDHTFTKPVNGVVRLGHQHLQQIQNGPKPLDTVPEHRSNSPISLQDFRVAMTLNPHQLGTDWPVLLEKICTREHEE